MRADRQSCRRRHGPRPVRVLSLGERQQRRRPITSAAAESYLVGLDASMELRRLFPDWYAAHVAHRPLTPSTLYGAARAFISLVERDMFPLRDCWDLDIPRDPLTAFNHGETDDVCLGSLIESAWFLVQPHPLVCGVGVQLVSDYYVGELEIHFATLPVALWHLFQKTNWGLGIDLDNVLERIDEDDRIAILGLTPLPKGTRAEMLCAALGEGDPKAEGTLVAYAFGRTLNVFADTSDLEIEYVYNGDSDLSWEEAPGYVEEIREARLIEAAFDAWAENVKRDPERELAALVKRLQAAAKSLKPPRPAKPLIEILADSEQFAEQEALPL
jgi:hypothetical protein